MSPKSSALVTAGSCTSKAGVPFRGCVEAALAIAGTHSEQAFDALRDTFLKAHDPWWRSVLLSAIALTRQDAALEFLLELIRKEALEAEAAIDAILRSVPSKEVTERLEKLVEGNPRLKRLVAAQKGKTTRTR
jgi:hypothetical protein